MQHYGGRFKNGKNLGHNRGVARISGRRVLQNFSAAALAAYARARTRVGGIDCSRTHKALLYQRTCRPGRSATQSLPADHCHSRHTPTSANGGCSSTLSPPLATPLHNLTVIRLVSRPKTRLRTPTGRYYYYYFFTRQYRCRYKKKRKESKQEQSRPVADWTLSLRQPRAYGLLD